jgi:hypothetical protein
VVHGGEMIGRGSVGPSLVIQGDIYGWDESVERIRSSLYNRHKLTGLGVA